MTRLSLLIAFVLVHSIAGAQWINEIHYDNDGTDSGECIEIAGPAGTNMADFSIVLYNGSSPYDTDALSGTIPDEGCGYGAVSICYPSNGIQNGGSDGIVLYNTATATVIQFLSYEGVINATSGVANGLTSTDIGVSEANSASYPVGSSMQLTGTGSTYGSFAWTSVGAASSFGSINSGQTISPCGSNTITTGAITGAPFTVDCSVPTTAAGTVAFTSSGTFNVGNNFIVQLSDETGSFASPTAIGSIALSGVDPFGAIPFTIPSGVATGTGTYLIRVISDDPSAVGSDSAPFTITQSGNCGPTLPASEGLIINEWSNGPAGNEEFYEFVVAGQCGTSVDIRGYILDDNNATFTNPADYDATASGIAPGHFRFAYDVQWSSVPVGSLIVVYNGNEPNPALPPDDPTDADNDSLYVIPHNNALFERCTTFPQPSNPDSTYTGCTYAVAPLTGWNPLSLRNSGDAIQVRFPDGAYYHGVSYGGSEMTGGPDNLKLFTGSGSAMCGWFTDGDFFDAANWSSGSVGGNETPGLPNNPLNYEWLKLMRDPAGTTCPIVVLPVELFSFEGVNTSSGNVLLWKTATERNSSYFTIERSIDGVQWESIGTVDASGNSLSELSYQFLDVDFRNTLNYYRLIQTDADGTAQPFNRIVVIDNSLEVENRIVGRYNTLGQAVDANYTGVQIIVYEDGTSERIFKP